MMDYRDIVIADLADAEAVANRRLSELEDEKGIFREIAIVAMQQLARTEAQRDAARAALYAIRKQSRERAARPMGRAA